MRAHVHGVAKDIEKTDGKQISQYSPTSHQRTFSKQGAKIPHAASKTAGEDFTWSLYLGCLCSLLKLLLIKI